MEQELEALVEQTRLDAERVEEEVRARHAALLEGHAPLQELRRANDATQAEVERLVTDLERLQRSAESDPVEASLRRATARELLVVLGCAAFAALGAWGTTGIFQTDFRRFGVVFIALLLGTAYKLWTDE